MESNCHWFGAAREARHARPGENPVIFVTVDDPAPREQRLPLTLDCLSSQRSLPKYSENDHQHFVLSTLKKPWSATGISGFCLTQPLINRVGNHYRIRLFDAGE